MNYDAINAKLRALKANPVEDIKNVVLRISMHIHSRPHRNFCLAMALGSQDGINYYTRQWKRLGQLDKASRSAIKPILGAEIDLNNILWLYRLKRYHRVYGAASYGHLIPVRYRLTEAMTQRMADCKSPGDLLAEVGRSPYARDIVFHVSKGQPTPEEQLVLAINKRYQAAARKYANTIVPVLAYIYLEVHK